MDKTFEDITIVVDRWGEGVFVTPFEDSDKTLILVQQHPAGGESVEQTQKKDCLWTNFTSAGFLRYKKEQSIFGPEVEKRAKTISFWIRYGSPMY